MPEPEEDVVVKFDEEVVPEVVEEPKIEEPEGPTEIEQLTAKLNEMLALKDTLKGQANFASRSQRVIERLEREISELKQRPSLEEKDINALLENDLGAGIREIVVNSLREQKEAEKKEKEIQDIENERSRQQEILDKNTARVLSAHPELADPNSEKSKVWMEILDNHPEYKTNYLGPLQTMRDMEEVFNNRVKPKGNDIGKEIARRERVKETSVGSGSKPVQKSNEIVLSKDQKDLCDHNGWDYKTYAKTLKRLSGENNVEV